MRICIIGLGYVGAVTSICFARDGHAVYGVDIDSRKLDLIRSGKSPVIEEGTQELTRSVVGSGQLEVGEDLPEDLGEYDVVFVCVGTPSDDRGAHNLDFVERVAEQIGDRFAQSRSASYPVVVIRSTVLPGTTEDRVKPVLESSSGKRSGEDFGLCFQPEFLREGSSIRDFDNPPFTVVGSDSPRSSQVLERLFSSIDAAFHVTDVRTSEMLKIACNAFHALKISFANELGRLGRAAGVDSREMMRLLCEDTQLNISPAYLRPGFAFGGSCLPKDLRALTHLGVSQNVETPLLQGVLATNERHIEHALKLVMAGGHRKIAMLGLSFKAGTDDLRESPAVTLAERLIGKGYELRVYDPAVKVAQLMGSNKRYIETMLPHIGKLVSDCVEEVIAFGDVVVVTQNSDSIVTALGAVEKPVIDLVGIGSAKTADRYAGLCW